MKAGRPPLMPSRRRSPNHLEAAIRAAGETKITVTPSVCPAMYVTRTVKKLVLANFKDLPANQEVARKPLPRLISSMNWKRMWAYISGSVDEELLLQNEYLAVENRILKNQIKGRLRLTDAERINLAEIGRRLGRKALEEVAQIVRPRPFLVGTVNSLP